MLKTLIAIAVALAGFATSAAAAAPKDAQAQPTKVDGRVAQREKMKKCNADAKDKSGDERRQFMSQCLKK